MGFTELITYITQNGYLSTAIAFIFGIATLVLKFQNNGIAKKLFDNNLTIADLISMVNDLKQAVKELKENNLNTNEMLSSTIDMIHVAYAQSNLDVNTKLQLQKIYDKCPDALADQKDKLYEILEENATEEQIQEVVSQVEESAVDTIINKLK